jgi:hypothetical protein
MGGGGRAARGRAVREKMKKILKNLLTGEKKLCIICVLAIANLFLPPQS